MGIFDWFFGLKNKKRSDNYYTNGQIKKEEKEITRSSKTHTYMVTEYYENGDIKSHRIYNNGRCTIGYLDPSGKTDEVVESEKTELDERTKKILTEYNETHKKQKDKTLDDKIKDGSILWEMELGRMGRKKSEKEDTVEVKTKDIDQEEKQDNKESKSRVSVNDTEDIGIVTHYNGIPFTGIMFWEYENGNTEGECEMINGLKNGVSKTYYENGQLKRFENYKEDNLNGIVKFYDKNGQLEIEGRSNGGDKKYGLWKFYSQGNLITEGTFKKNKKDGVWKKYDENGQITIEENYINDLWNGVSKQYYKNGQLKESIEYNKGLKNGLNKTYYLNGILKVEGDWKNDKLQGVCKTYYENGQLKKSIEYKKGLKNGVCKTYYENGNLRNQINWEEDTMNGTCKFYYENGQLITGGNIRNGQKIQKEDWKTYLENGEEGKVDLSKFKDLQGFNIPSRQKITDLEVSKNMGNGEELKTNRYPENSFKEWWDNHYLEISENIRKIIEEEIDTLREDYHNRFEFENGQVYEDWEGLYTSIFSQNLHSMGSRINEMVDDYWDEEWDEEDETYIYFEQEFLNQISPYSEK